MQLKVSRRKFIASTLASGAAVCLGGWWAFKVSSTDRAEMIAQIVKKNLDYLKHDEARLLAFAHDAAARMKGGENYRLDWLRRVRPVYGQINVFDYTPRADKFRALEDRITKQYLMSSDFFLNDADETRTISYINYHDPYAGACVNPFANFD